jgi:SAM-dependent methyltransferase
MPRCICSADARALAPSVIAWQYSQDMNTATIKKMLRHVPGMTTAWAALRGIRGRKARFAADYHENSGIGSDMRFTEVIVREVPILLRELGIRSVLDVPCGDFRWMARVDLSGIHYTGGDIIDSLVASLQTQHAAPGRVFRVLDLVSEPLPEADLVLCRDCLVHLSSRLVRKAVANIKKSRAKYVLTTTFPEHPKNRRIVSGDWRPLNLCAAPFNFPPAMRVIREGYSAPFEDKSLGLWRVSDLPDL